MMSILIQKIKHRREYFSWNILFCSYWTKNAVHEAFQKDTIKEPIWKNQTWFNFSCMRIELNEVFSFYEIQAAFSFYLDIN